MAGLQGCLAALATWLGLQGEGQGGTDRVVGPWPPPPPLAPVATMELFAMPGHGRTSYLWSLLFTLRQLSRLWPGYLCWPGDDETGRSLREIHQKLQLGVLPNRSSATPGPPRCHTLDLRNLDPWGDRRFTVWDSRDPAFAAAPPGSTIHGRPAVDWNVPLMWLLSLSDLDATGARFLDLALDELVRVRFAAGEAANRRQMRVVVVFTKGDAVPDLPAGLRSLLKADPLADKLATSPGGMFRAHDEVTWPRATATGPEPLPTNDPLRAYFDSRHDVDALLRAWVRSNSLLRGLHDRAAELDVEMRFSVVSATGSGFGPQGRLATAWSPRRVLDPYFWSLELGA